MRRAPLTAPRGAMRRRGRAAAACVALLAAGCAPARPPATGTLAVGDGGALRYVTVPAAAPVAGSRTVVVLHGGPGATHDYLRPEWDRLAAVGRVIYYDQRGCGGSTRRGPYTWQTHVRDLGALLDSVAPGERVVLAGSSWGALLAVLFARADARSRPGGGRVAALVLSGTPSWPAPAGAPRAALDSLPDALVYGRPAVDTVPVERRAPLRVPLPARGPGGAAREFTACLGAAPSPRNLATVPPLDSLRALSAPALVVMGTDTLGLPPMLRDQGAALAAALPGARRTVIEGAGHDPWLERPDAFFAAVRRFLADGGAPP